MAACTTSPIITQSLTDDGCEEEIRFSDIKYPNVYLVHSTISITNQLLENLFLQFFQHILSINYRNCYWNNSISRKHYFYFYRHLSLFPTFCTKGSLLIAFQRFSFALYNKCTSQYRKPIL